MGNDRLPVFCFHKLTVAESRDNRENPVMDKAQLIDNIRNAEGLDDETKSALIALCNERKKYGIVWEEKTEDVEERLRIHLPVLEEVKDRAIISSDPTAPNHILIEGDNLEALTSLSFTHEGKIDVIYIDPPYNTGNKDFIYNDRYVDTEDSFRHSKWLSFMKPRLIIAKRLLSDQGVIFISIDDNEYSQLKVLSDEIFHERNYISTLIWNLGTGTKAGHFTRSHEYILSYANNKLILPNFSGGSGLIDHSALKKISVKNPPIRYKFEAGTKFDAPDGTELRGEWGGSEKTKLISGRMIAENGKLKYDVELEAGFAMINQMRSWFSGKNTLDSKGQRVVDFYFNSTGVLHYKKDRSVVNPPSVLSDVGSTKGGSVELEAILRDDEAFGYPKPISLLKFLISLKQNHSTILDFFAGSGTTLHATMQLNAEDGGHRQCILVTNNENGICENVTYERNKRVINGYTTPKGVEVAGLTDNNLRYYRTRLVDRDMRTAKARRQLMECSTDLLCIKNNVYTETALCGKRVNPQVARYFEDGDNRMLVIYNEEFIQPLIPLIKELPNASNKVKVYVFSADNYAYDADFAEVLDRVDPVALPAAILKAYKRVLPEAKFDDGIEEFAVEEVELQTQSEEGGEA